LNPFRLNRQVAQIGRLSAAMERSAGALAPGATKKGRTEVRPKFREEKPEGLAEGTPTGPNRRIKVRPRSSTNG
jgi:hypothetical protein